MGANGMVRGLAGTASRFGQLHCDTDAFKVESLGLGNVLGMHVQPRPYSALTERKKAFDVVTNIDGLSCHGSLCTDRCKNYTYVHGCGSDAVDAV